MTREFNVVIERDEDGYFSIKRYRYEIQYQ